MNREKFIKQLEYLLRNIPQNERMEAIQYYQDYFEDAGVEHERKVILELESPEKVAAFIQASLRETEQSEDDLKEYTENGYEDIRFANRKYMPEQIMKESRKFSQPKRKNDNVLFLLLLILLAIPVGLPLLGILIAGGVVGIIVPMVLAIVPFILMVAFGISGIVLFVIGTANISIIPAFALIIMGVGLILGGLAILALILAIWYVGKVIPVIIRGIVKMCKIPFNRGGQYA